jgi:Rhodopirellula transposase DDE domain
MRDLMVTREMLAAKFETILPHLDERQRRLVLGAEARALGHGGIALVAAAAGVRAGTVAAGAAELEAGAEPLGRARRPGGGRRRLAETDPGLVAALLALVEPEERGDPQSPLRWTVKSVRTLAGELTAAGHKVSADTVHRLLREQGFSLQGNARVAEGRQHRDRDAQFRYINEQVEAAQAAGDPVISVDAKKKEQVGEYANAGCQWRPAGEPARVADHDFPGRQPVKAIPYGVYDLAADTGWVNVGTDHDTAAFAVESVRRWWQGRGRLDYPAARRLLITADAGGSNSYRSGAWKSGLAALAAETGLAITCCHFPPGTSKWNKIEHRLFCHITMNWRGRPLTSHQVIVNSIAATTTRTGLIVHAELDTGLYPTGITISREHLAALPLTSHDWHGEWNYTLAPAATTVPAPPPRARPPAPPRPSLAWLTHPAITGMPATTLDTLTAILAAPAAALRDATLYRRRGHRPRQAPSRGPRPRLTLTDKLTAAILHDRHGLPYKDLATLYQTRHEYLCRNTTAIRRLLHQAGHTIQPATPQLATLGNLYQHAAKHRIHVPAQLNPAC